MRDSERSERPAEAGPECGELFLLVPMMRDSERSERPAEAGPECGEI